MGKCMSKQNRCMLINNDKYCDNYVNISNINDILDLILNGYGYNIIKKYISNDIINIIHKYYDLSVFDSKYLDNDILIENTNQLISGVNKGHYYICCLNTNINYYNTYTFTFKFNGKLDIWDEVSIGLINIKYKPSKHERYDYNIDSIGNDINGNSMGYKFTNISTDIIHKGSVICNVDYQEILTNNDIIIITVTNVINSNAFLIECNIPGKSFIFPVIKFYSFYDCKIACGIKRRSANNQSLTLLNQQTNKTY